MFFHARKCTKRACASRYPFALEAPSSSFLVLSDLERATSRRGRTGSAGLSQEGGGRRTRLRLRRVLISYARSHFQNPCFPLAGMGVSNFSMSLSGYAHSSKNSSSWSTTFMAGTGAPSIAVPMTAPSGIMMWSMFGDCIFAPEGVSLHTLRIQS